MKLSKLLGERFKEKPVEASLQSHIFLLKGGYIRQVTAGVYSLLPPAKKIAAKIEAIIRQEMDAIDGQEVLFPVVLPAELWEESGRYASITSELARFNDRHGHKLLLGMTHEEASVHLARTEALSHTKYPFMIYQIQTKFRDEARPRGGLVRVREFTMKDAYSFHTTQQDLDDYYKRCLEAYDRIYKRVGVPEVICVESDSGMMGGSISHEFMFLCEDGEDTIAVCDCGYKANMEVAESIAIANDYSEITLEKVHTGKIKSIEGLSKFFDLPLSGFMKAVVFGAENYKKPIIVFIRGDRDINEDKLMKLLKSKVFPFNDYESVNTINFGFIGPKDLDTSDAIVYFDKSLENEKNLVCGANEEDYHIKGLSVKRDLSVTEFYDISTVRSGDKCLRCSGSVELVRGIEVGNIFQLGKKYTETMNMKYTDEDGSLKTPLMGCYGIGVGRLLASVLEAKHDNYGPIWPMSIAPWQVHICALDKKKDGVIQAAEQIYSELQSKGFDVIYDDREVNAGVQFADADLLGVPVRVIISPKNLANNNIEIATRDKSVKKLVDKDCALDEIISMTNTII